MDLFEYKREALRTDFAEYSDFHTGDATARLDYATLGLVTESAKVLDIIKKSKKNIKPIDQEKITEELGDLLWYLNLTLDELGVSYEELMENNLKKIQKKYEKDKRLIRG